MLDWIMTLLRRPRTRQATDNAIETADHIAAAARSLRGSMLEETRASNNAQREMRADRESHWFEEELLKRLERKGGRHNA